MNLVVFMLRRGIVPLKNTVILKGAETGREEQGEKYIILLTE